MLINTRISSSVSHLHTQNIFLCNKCAFWTMFMFSVFLPLPACLGWWIEKKSGKVCFAISFIVLLALASIKEIQEQWEFTLGIYIATAVPNSLCSRDCISLLHTGWEKWKKVNGIFPSPPKFPGLHTGLEQTWGCSLLGGNVGQSCLALWQGCDSEQSPQEPGPILAPLAARTFPSCQLLFRAGDIIH